MSAEPCLNICEIFYSLQGESTFAGLPCVFVRLADCNLDCSYCDTKYSHFSGKPMQIAEIVEAITDYPPVGLVEITGGEPLLQDNVTFLMQKLQEHGYQILLETNGSMYVGEVPDYVIKIMDVKTPGSGHGDSFMKWNLKCLNPQDELKFVITNFYDYAFARKFLDEHQLWDQTILFSPVQTALPASKLAEWILRDGIKARLQLQLHKLLDIK
ncbi:MAG: radical SAM protein [Candidatus Cloacimonadaceae bacterium]|nr:radical SAM protein [Candidatus Cloacimonadaceae bacterium]